MAGPPKKNDKKKAAGGEAKKKPASKISKVYEVSGNSLKRKNKYCPKCGNGVFMADHKDRWTCGKCNYMERK